MSFYTRLASTDEQEESVAVVETAFRKLAIAIGGATVIGKSPQTVIMDVFRNDSKIYINAVGEIKIEGVEYKRSERVAMMARIKTIREEGRKA